MSTHNKTELLTLLLSEMERAESLGFALRGFPTALDADRFTEEDLELNLTMLRRLTAL